MTVKPTNPKDGLGIRKVPIHCLPMQVMSEVGLAMMEGGRKYGAHNYRDAGVKASVYIDAVFRHLFLQFWEGEDVDADSNLSHVTKAIASLIVMRDSMLMGNWIDDRPIRHPDGPGAEWLNQKAGEIIDKYPECKDPFTHTGLIPRPGDESKDPREERANIYKAGPDDGCENCRFNNGPPWNQCVGAMEEECIATYEHPHWKPVERKTDENQ